MTGADIPLLTIFIPQFKFLNFHLLPLHIWTRKIIVTLTFNTSFFLSDDQASVLLGPSSTPFPTVRECVWGKTSWKFSVVKINSVYSLSYLRWMVSMRMCGNTSSRKRNFLILLPWHPPTLSPSPSPPTPPLCVYVEIFDSWTHMLKMQMIVSWWVTLFMKNLMRIMKKVIFSVFFSGSLTHKFCHNFLITLFFRFAQSSKKIWFCMFSRSLLTR